MTTQTDARKGPDDWQRLMSRVGVLERALAKANADKAVLVEALKAFIEANANGPADKWIQRMVECDVKARAALSRVQA